jgi:sarcosine oxidase subunit alpha
MTSFRLSQGGAIDRSRTLRFTFDGKSFNGHPGDTLASALLANGVGLVGRSFKYHRPRGILTAGAAEPNALVTIGRGGRTEPNTRATTAELYEGLEAVSQNRWPSLDFDIGSLNSLLSPFLGAGFYYKTFMWPAGLWERLYEPFIRRAAGLGKASYEADPDAYEKCWAHCDLLVIGSGAAGLSAALTAGRAGARVILAEEKAEAGGSLLAETGSVDGKTPHEAVAAALAELSGMENVRILPRTTVFGWFDSQVFGAIERVQKHVALPDPNRPVERLWRIVAKQAVLASGAEERPIVFGGNDVPGVMMAGAIRSYANHYGVAAGRRVALFTANDSAYAVAADLERQGVEVAAIIDNRAAPMAGWTGSARVIAGGAVIGTTGGKSLDSITVTSGAGLETLMVDALGMSGGWSPVIHLACHRGGKPVWDNERAAFLAPQVKGLLVAGGAAGDVTLSQAMQSGAEAAVRALQEIGIAASPAPLGTMESEYSIATPKPLWSVKGIRGKAFVDYQNDVHYKDLTQSVREGYGDVELAKRYTTNGMATDQGKLSNINAIGILAEARGVSPAVVGTTTFRPFYTPVSFGALAGTGRGKHFQPIRRSPLHGWAEKNGAVFVETGLWYRSSWFPRAGETGWRQSVDREVLNTRENAGLCDVSTLGKIEIYGTDAAEFLNRVYINAFAKLPVGKARYGLMLREDGMVYDDGTTSRLGENHYFMTTTTALAAGVMTHLEFCAQALWPELDVRLASATDQWAQMAIAGPKSRQILQRIVDEDLSDAAFPFLAARSVSLFGGRLEGRLFRISFSGELAYELAVPSGFGEAVADALMEAGRADGIQPYGVEALGVMRIEKGHVTHNEINGRVTPGDLGFAKMVSSAKPDFIGKVMLGREGLQDPKRPRLVGVKPLRPADSFRTGSHILAKDVQPSLEASGGYVTSSAFSPVLGHTIGLALVVDGPERHGEEVQIYNALRGEFTAGVLCDPVFVDPRNEKLHV